MSGTTSGQSRAPTGSAVSLAAAVAMALHATQAEVAAHEEMRRIRLREAQGLATSDERRRYRTLWVALRLRRSTCSRVISGPDVDAAVARFRRAREALQNERARAAVDAAFVPEDGAPMEDHPPASAMP